MPPTKPQGRRDFTVRQISRSRDKFTRKHGLSRSSDQPTPTDGVWTFIAMCHHHIHRPCRTTAAPPDKRSRGGGGRAKKMASRFTSLHCVRPSAFCFAPNAGIGRQLELVSFLSHWFCNLCATFNSRSRLYTPFIPAFRFPPAYPPPRHSPCIAFSRCPCR